MDKSLFNQHIATVSLLAAAGSIVGTAVAFWSRWLCRKSDQSANSGPRPDRKPHTVPHLLAGMLIFAAYAVSVFTADSLRITEVRPDPFSIWVRVFGHLILLSLLLAATSTDLRDYIIPDQITFPGTLAGILLATASGDTQIMHLWVDWNHPLAHIGGPEIPEWIGAHRHLHGLAWSAAGAVAGGGITLLVQRLATVILGQPAMGTGDVTLMTMIGSFLGWQAVLIVFLVSPLCGVIIGMTFRLVTNRSYVPYGPYLAAGAVLTLLCWRWIWTLEVPSVFSVRRLFGDAMALGMLAAIASVGFVTLLGSIRLFRTIPGRLR